MNNITPVYERGQIAFEAFAEVMAQHSLDKDWHWSNVTPQVREAWVAATRAVQQREPGENLYAATHSLVSACYGAAFKSGWWIDTETGEDVRNWPPKFFKLWVSAKLMLVVTEIGEGMEGHRKDRMDDKLPHRKMIEVELADAVIRIMDLAGGLGFDLGGAIVDKMAFNATRADHKIENRVAAGGKSI